MPLEKNMNSRKISDYLTLELKQAIRDDIRPCLNLGHDKGDILQFPDLY